MHHRGSCWSNSFQSAKSEHRRHKPQLSIVRPHHAMARTLTVYRCHFRGTAPSRRTSFLGHARGRMAFARVARHGGASGHCCWKLRPRGSSILRQYIRATDPYPGAMKTWGGSKKVCACVGEGVVGTTFPGPPPPPQGSRNGDPQRADGGRGGRGGGCPEGPQHI